MAAETILYQARIMQNQGKLSAETFNKILDIYDKLKAAQDLAINARKALLAYNTAENQNKAIAAMNSVLSLSSELISVATDYGLIKGGQ